MRKTVTVEHLVKHFNLIVATGEKIIPTKPIEVPEISRPGVEMLGYYEFTDLKRIVLLGNKELSFISSISQAEAKKCFGYFTNTQTPAIIVTQGHPIPQLLLDMATKKDFIVLRSNAKTSMLQAEIITYLSELMAPTISIHGTLVNIFGSGVLLTGRSGIGKSEIALELVKKGQQLVADDRVEISQIRRTLMGSALEVSYGYMEIRGLGIFDLSKIFGINALKKSMKIDYVINLIELSDNAINIDRIGADKTVTYLNIDIPYIDLPVSLGRNMADIVEIATTILRLKDAGVVNSDDFEKRILAFRENL